MSREAAQIQALKVHRLYKQWRAAEEELKHQAGLVEEAQARWKLAASKEHNNRVDYNQALAEYRELLTQKNQLNE